MEKRLPEIEKALDKAKHDHQQAAQKEAELNEKVGQECLR